MPFCPIAFWTIFTSPYFLKGIHTYVLKSNNQPPGRLWHNHRDIFAYPFICVALGSYNQLWLYEQVPSS